MESQWPAGWCPNLGESTGAGFTCHISRILCLRRLECMETLLLILRHFVGGWFRPRFICLSVIVACVVSHASAGGVVETCEREPKTECFPVMNVENVIIRDYPVDRDIVRSIHDGPVFNVIQRIHERISFASGLLFVPHSYDVCIVIWRQIAPVTSFRAVEFLYSQNRELLHSSQLRYSTCQLPVSLAFCRYWWLGLEGPKPY